MDIYIDGQRWRIASEIDDTKLIVDRLREFGAVEKNFDLDIVDENGNSGVIRINPSRLSSIAIVEVEDTEGAADTPLFRRG